MKRKDVIIVAWLALMVSCSNNNTERTAPQQDTIVVEDTTAAAHEEYNSAYYWRTIFRLDSTERQFLKTHDVERLYIRMFDVVENTLLDDDKLRVEKLVPNATIMFKDSVPVSHIVPTVYITTDALRNMKNSTIRISYAAQILTRVMNMCSYNGIVGVEEIQLDCDWTESTRFDFFGLCGALKREILSRSDTKDIALSSTIRLHQLSQSPPPVDRGVLMVYNTGSFLNPDEKNSILSYDDVKPYLGKLKGYPLHLDFAYPIYRWGLVYRNDHFEGLLRDTDISSLQTKKIKNNSYRVIQDGYISGKKVKKGDVIRIENSDYETVIKVKKAIEAVADSSHSTILYHLSPENIKRYKEEEINEIYK